VSPDTATGFGLLAFDDLVAGEHDVEGRVEDLADRMFLEPRTDQEVQLHETLWWLRLGNGVT
jgi:hypothetical protein